MSKKKSRIKDRATQTEVNNLYKKIKNGGPTAERPSDPSNFERYFDTDLNKPIWWNGTDWVDSTGTII